MGIGVIYPREKKAQGSLIALCNYLKGGGSKSEVGLFSQATRDNNTGGNDLKLHQRRFSLDIRNNFFTERVGKHTADSPSLEILIRCEDVLLRNIA